MTQYGKNEIQWEGKARQLVYGYKWSLQKTDNKWQPNQGYENHPITGVSWYGAYAFCRHYGLNLPTEAQWEYAARGGVETSQVARHTYAGSNKIDEVAWHSGNSDYKHYAVGQKKENELKLYDMSGNVYEWCSDWYYDKYYVESPETNPEGPQEGSSRVLRSGSWHNDAGSCRVAYRGSLHPHRDDSILGFRAAFIP